MLDLKLLRQDIQAVSDQLKKRGFELDIAKFQDLEAKRKACQIETEQYQNQRNQLSKLIAQNRNKQTESELDLIKNQVSQINIKLSDCQDQLDQIQTELNIFLSEIPNLLHDSVPTGKNEETDNLEIRRWGEPRVFDFPILDHVALGEKLSGVDFEAAHRIAGARFVVLSGKIAKLHRALAQFMLDTHTTAHGYLEINPPVLVHERCLYGNGQFPKFKTDVFAVAGTEYYLTPTAEAELANLNREQVLDIAVLPLKLTAHTLCFRSEAGSYGKDTRGMIRQHQFEKVELFQMTTPEQSYDALEQIVQHAETILQQLKLPYRVILKCAGDTGFQSTKTYDLEVWLPGQQKYREISSCSNCEDFQARRLQTRYRDTKNSKQLNFVHTLNGSGLAVGRTLIAVLENYQTSDGDFMIPEVLKKYF